MSYPADIELTTNENTYLKQWRKAILTNNIEEVLECYDYNSVLLGTIAPSYEVKKNNVRNYFVEFFGKNTITDVTYLSVIDQHLEQARFCLISSGVYVFERLNDTPVKARFSFVFFKPAKTQNFIINHHSSIPAE